MHALLASPNIKSESSRNPSRLAAPDTTAPLHALASLVDQSLSVLFVSKLVENRVYHRHGWQWAAH